MRESEVAKFSTVLKHIIKFPKGIEFYELDGRIIFTIRDKSGNLTSESIIYLIRKPQTPKSRIYYRYGIKLNTWDALRTYEGEINKAIKEFTRLLKSKKSISRYKLDPNGGDMGTGDNV